MLEILSLLLNLWNVNNLLHVKVQYKFISYVTNITCGNLKGKLKKDIRVLSILSYC